MINKNRLLSLALPLTIIIFILFSKWWIADVVDASDYIMYGFPLIYKCPAFHTSLAQQYFIMELFIDILAYFSLVFSLLFLKIYLDCIHSWVASRGSNPTCPGRRIII